MADPLTEPTATDRVRAAIAAGAAIDRKTVEHALREAFGLSARKARTFCSEGVRALSVVEEETNLSDAVAQLSKRLSDLARQVDSQ